MIKDISTDVAGHPLIFNGDIRLRKANTKILLNKEQLDEFVKCKNDRIYFIEKYVKIMVAGKGLTYPKLYSWQKKMFKLFDGDTRIAMILPRQVGKSLSVALYMTHLMLFNRDMKNGIAADKEKTAKEIFLRIKEMLYHVPHFLKPGIVELSKTKLDFDNGSGIVVSATSETGISGFTCSGMLLLDEVALINSNLWDKFYASMEPVVASDPNAKLVIVSTPKGYNHFEKIIRGAREGYNGYSYFTQPWDCIPMRDEAWKAQKVLEVGPEKFSQEYACVVGETLVEIKNKITGEIKKVSMKELYSNSEYK